MIAMILSFFDLPPSMIVATLVVAALSLLVLLIDWRDDRRRRQHSEKIMRELQEYERALKTKDPEL